jgi:hypothetical protein
MRKPEQKVYDELKRTKPYGIRMERIENGLGSGTADLHLLSQGQTVWFETKHLIVPVMATTPIIKNDTFEKDQPKWHMSIAIHGGRSYVVAKDTLGQWYLIPGKDIPKVLHARGPAVAAAPTLQAVVTPSRGMTRKELKAGYAVAGLPELWQRVFSQKTQPPAWPSGPALRKGSP